MSKLCSRRVHCAWWASVALGLLGACAGDPAPKGPLPLSRAVTDRNYLRDTHGRYLFFHGINVSGSTKVPASIDGKPFTIADLKVPNAKGLTSYVGKPFAATDTDAELKKLRDAGFNVIRLLVNWEGVEPTKKGQYDQAYLKSLRAIVQKANEYGIYVLMDMHQDMFSRHLLTQYNETPSYFDKKLGKIVPAAPGTLENTLLALFPPYTDTVRGEGAPRWVVEACLPEKKLDSKHWGKPRLISGLDGGGVVKIAQLYVKLLVPPGGTPTIPDWAQYVVDNLPEETFSPSETSDMLPFTNWGLAAALSLDLARVYGAFFAGEKLFPGLRVKQCNDVPLPADITDCKAITEIDVKEYLQDAYGAAWRQVAGQVADLPNVIGYDIMNEPNSNFIVLTAVAALLKTGTVEGARQTVVGMLGKETGDLLTDSLIALCILPVFPDKPDAAATAEQQKAYEGAKQKILVEWGLDKLDVLAAAGMNTGFDKNWLQPFYERIGADIRKVDPKAVIFSEPTSNITSIAGGELGGMWDMSMTRPKGLPHVVYAPHYYADAYPYLGFNMPPRDFSVEEVRYRDYTTALKKVMAIAQFSMGNVPVVFGEFGTYFNFGGIDKSVASQYAVSSAMLDNYFEAFEQMFQSQMLWCYTPDNDKQYGDWWNKEDFSIQGFDRKWRGESAWMRPFARALAGRPISTHYYSPNHYFDPHKGVVDPVREFEVSYQAKETRAPSEIYVPKLQYPDGFYVWTSDGTCHYDAATQTLSHLPANDEPGAEHWVRIAPPRVGEPAVGWRWFFKGDKMLTAH